MSKLGLLCVALGFLLQSAAAFPGQAIAGVSAPSSATAAQPSTAPGRSGAAACPEASVTIDPLPAGQARLELRSPCRAGEDVQIRYGGFEFYRRIDGEGKLEFLFDCIAGPNEQAQLTFLDGSALQKTVSTLDLDQTTKVAVVWRGSVNLDLHAFEYAAEFGEPGHVWAGAPSSLAEAQAAMQRDGRFHGFLSIQANGALKGDQLEVYTLWRGPARPGASHASGAPGSGIIAMALDYASRETDPQDSETCGYGIFSEMNYDIIVREPSGATKRASGAFAPLECGVKLQKASRYNTKSIPYIK